MHELEEDKELNPFNVPLIWISVLFSRKIEKNCAVQVRLQATPI